jgi:starvation-inducible DNA-binding protein
METRTSTRCAPSTRLPTPGCDTVATSTTLPEFLAFVHNTTEVVDLIAARLCAVDTIRSVYDQLDEQDLSTAALLHQLIDGLEKQAWLIESENRKV